MGHFYDNVSLAPQLSCFALSTTVCAWFTDHEQLKGCVDLNVLSGESCQPVQLMMQSFGRVLGSDSCTSSLRHPTVNHERIRPVSDFVSGRGQCSSTL